MKKTLLAALTLALCRPAFAQVDFQRQVEDGVAKFNKVGGRELHPNAVAPGKAGQIRALPSPAGEQELIDLIAQSMPSVVVIKTNDSTGTGFIVDPSGLVLTNEHVIEGVDLGGEVDITLNDKRKIKGKVVAVGDKARRDKDMALVQLEGEKGWKWNALSFADEKSAVPGRYVVALGHPKDLEFTPTTGIVSAVDRWFDDSVLRFVQTNAAINPGNSGGPLINMQGQVLGMNTQIVTEGGGSEGLGFAITAQDCVRGIEQYNRTGNLKIAYIGAALFPGEKNADVTITAVMAGPAKTAGLKVGDKILSIDGQDVKGEDGKAALRAALRALAFRSPGETIPFFIERNHVQIELDVKAGDFPKPPKGVIASLEAPAPRFAFADAGTKAL